MTGSNATTARVPLRTVIASIVALWLCYFVLATARGWLFGLAIQDAILARRLLVLGGSVGVTLLFWPLLRVLDSRPLWVKVLAVLVAALPASLALAAINQVAFADIENQVVEKIGEREGLSIRRDEAGNLLVDVADDAVDAEVPPPAPPAAAGAATPTAAVPTIAEQEQSAALTIDRDTRLDTRWLQLTDVALGRYFLLLAWAAVYFSLVNAEQARAAERREGEYRRAAKAAELRSLRYQVNPHFLFNTLNSLSALVLTGKSRAAETMIQTLSTFYRRSLADDPTADVPLAQEIEQQRLYLELEAVRFPDRLVARFEIPPELAEATVPGMILQPLVENAVRYAVAPHSQPVTLTVAATAAAGQLVLTVHDDGAGAAVASSGFGIGLGNVRDRLTARFGPAARLTAGPDPRGGWRAEIRMPLERGDD